ncbi:MAG: hypothetical protein MJZ45_05160 [Bacteroidales bacterium]|nr:hypothetical protein [Bacteroidales bacterium]
MKQKTDCNGLTTLSIGYQQYAASLLGQFVGTDTPFSNNSALAGYRPEWLQRLAGYRPEWLQRLAGYRPEWLQRLAGECIYWH